MAIGLLAVLAVGGTAASVDRQVSTTVTICGRSLCLGGTTWPLSMGTVYHGLNSPEDSVARARALGLDAIRVTDFLDTSGPAASAPYDPQVWSRVDALVAAAGRAGLHVWLDLSTYRNLLEQAGFNPYTTDWTPFLRFVANRTNTRTNVHYADDPTIAVVGFAGEVDGINGGDNTYGLTTAELTAFFRGVERFWHEAAPRQLVTAGGLSNLDWNSGIDWRAIFSLPYNDIDSVHAYTAGDVDVSIPAVADYAASGNRPWVLEEFGYSASTPDVDRARLFTGMYATERKYGGAGVGFWNIGGQKKDTYDVGPQFPATFAAVRRWGQ